MKDMNIIDDVAANGGLSFGELPFNDVDSLVFAQLAYFPFETILENGGEKLMGDVDTQSVQVPKRGKERYKNHVILFKSAAASKRYGGFIMSDFVNDLDDTVEKQFCAICFRNDEFVYVSFRGTDATVAGWKEDVNLSFMDEIPAQKHAVEYLKHIAAKFPKHKIITGGHSKGGNLAIYSAAMAPQEVRRRVAAIFAHDSPGFRKEFFLTKGYLKIESKIRKTVPHSSIIGMMLENPTPFSVVDSKSVSIFQHNPYKWIVRNHSFVPKPYLHPGWYYFDSSLNKWIESISDEERKRFFDLIFLFLRTAGITDFRSRINNLSTLVKNLRGVYALYKELDDETKVFFKKTVRLFIDIMSEERRQNKNKTS